MAKRTSFSVAWIAALVWAIGVAAPAVEAQGTPTAGDSATGATFEPITSITREEYGQQLLEAFPMEEPGTEGGQVIWGQPSDISTVNPLLGADQPTNPFLSLVFQSLTDTSPIDGQPVPGGLADSWERAADGMTYTFRLNKDAKWHDGTDFTSEDVLFSLEAQLNPETGSQYTSTVDDVVDTYRIVDPDTFEIKSNGVRAAFLFDLILPVVPKHIWEGVPHAEWAEDPGSTGQDPSRVVGTGPFKFVEWVQEDHATLTRNDEYWDTIAGRVPTIETFTMQVFADETTLVQALKTGEIDFYEDVPEPEIEGLQTAEGITVETFDTFDFSYYIYNLDPEKSQVFQDKEVRQALFTALDRQAIIDSIFLGYGEVAVGTQSILSRAYAPDRIENPYAFDLEAARQLLEQAGWTDADGDGVREKNGVSLQFELIYTEGVATYEQLVPYMQQQWREVGADMVPAPVPFPTLLDAITETHDFDMALLGFSWVADPDQKAMFACNQYEGGFNSGRYCNPRYDELSQQADRELDPAKRLELLIELSTIVWEDLPVGIYRFVEDTVAYSNRMHNFHANDYAYVVWSMPWVWVEQ